MWLEIEFSSEYYWNFENESSERKKFSWESFDSFMTGKEVDRSSLSFYGDKQKVITMLFFRE